MEKDIEDEEENFLIDKLQAARHALTLHKNEDLMRKLTKNRLDKELEEIEQATIDYMQGNGLVQTERLTLGKSFSVIVPDTNKVPSDFLRVKTVCEPDKNLIKSLEPEGDWYTIEEKPFITVKGQ